MQGDDDKENFRREIISVDRNIRLSVIQALVGIFQTIMRWKVIDKVAEFLVEKFNVFESGRLVQFLKVMRDFAHDLGESLSQNDKGGGRRFGEGLGDDWLSRLNVGKLYVARFTGIAIGVSDRWRASQDERVTGERSATSCDLWHNTHLRSAWYRYDQTRRRYSVR